MEFYSAWECFSSGKKFSRVDRYDVMAEAYNRLERRYLDKENERHRKAARREFTDLVRELVIFVRRRDPRYKEAIKKRKEEMERREQEIQERERERRLREARELKGEDKSSPLPFFFSLSVFWCVFAFVLFALSVFVCVLFGVFCVFVHCVCACMCMFCCEGGCGCWLGVFVFVREL